MSDVDTLLRQGIAAVKAGQRARARALLQRVLRQRPNDVNAWLWLSGAVETDDDRRMCLERVLAIDSKNPHAKKGLEKLGPRVTPPPTAPQQLEPQPASKKTTQQKTRRSPVMPLVALGFVVFLVCGVAAVLLLIPPAPVSTIPPPPTHTPQPTDTPYPTYTPEPTFTPTPTPGLNQEEIEYLEIVQEALDATNLTWENMQRLLGLFRDPVGYANANPDSYWVAEMFANLIVPGAYYEILRDEVSVPAAFADAHRDLLVGFEHHDKAAKLILTCVDLWTESILTGADPWAQIDKELGAAALELDQGTKAVLRGIEEIERVKTAR